MYIHIIHTYTYTYTYIWLKRTRDLYKDRVRVNPEDERGGARVEEDT